MSYYAAPIYIGLSCLLSLGYGTLELVKNKGKTDAITNTILISWCLSSLIIAMLIGGTTAESMVHALSPLHIVAILLLTSVTLMISSFMIYWAS